MILGALHSCYFPELKKKQRLELERKIQEFLKPQRDLIKIDRSDIEIIKDNLGKFSKSVCGSITVRHIPTGYTRVVHVSQSYEKETYNPYVVYSCTARSGFSIKPTLWFRTMSKALCSAWGNNNWFKDSSRDYYKSLCEHERLKFEQFLDTLKTKE